MNAETESFLYRFGNSITHFLYPLNYISLDVCIVKISAPHAYPRHAQCPRHIAQNTCILLGIIVSIERAECCTLRVNLQFQGLNEEYTFKDYYHA